MRHQRTNNRPLEPLSARWCGPWRILAAAVLVFLLVPVQPVLSVEWPHHRRIGSFTFHANFALDRFTDLLAEVVGMRPDVLRQLQLVDSGELVDVYLFSDEDTYHRYMQRYFPDFRARRAMFVKANSPGNVFAYHSEEFDVDLRHESTHAVLHAALPYVPLWLDEGLAEYFEMSPETRSHGHEHLKSIRRWVRWKRPRSLAELEQIDQLENMGRAEYRDAWAWVHFMLHGPPEATAEFHEYLQQIDRGEVAEPLSSRLATRFPDLDRAFADHFRSWD